MSKTYGIGIVGAGVVFHEHARAYQALGGRTKMVGLADVDPQKTRNASDQYFIPFLTDDYKQLLERDDIDMIDVCTPPSLHEQVVIDALAAGKHVLCEKPIAHTLASADRISKAAQAASTQLCVVYQLRYSTNIKRMIWLRDQGLLGRLIFGRFSRYGNLSSTTAVSSGWWGKWQVAGGGALMTQFIHELDLLLYIFGAGTSVTATLATLKEPIESEDTVTATIQFESGAIVECFCTVAAQQWSLAYDIVGHDASVHVPWTVNSVNRGTRIASARKATQAVPAPAQPRFHPRVRQLMSRAGRFIPMLRPPRPAPEHRPLISDFLDAIDNGSAPPIDAHEARASLELCLAIYTAGMTGESVALPLQEGCRFYEGISSDDYKNRPSAPHSNE